MNSMKAKVEYFDENAFDRIYVLTDLHGCARPFVKFYRRINRKYAKDRILLVVLGDSCDRGKDSKKLYDSFMKIDSKKNRKVIHLMGNHEDFFINADEDKRKISAWISNGGLETLCSFDGEIRRLLWKMRKKENFFGKLLDIFSSGKRKEKYKKMLAEKISGYKFKEKIPKYIEYISNFPHIAASQSYIFVHASVNLSKPIEEQDPYEAMWIRGTAWQGITEGKKIFYGHTPQQRYTVNNGCYNLDTGLSYGGPMTVAQIANGEIKVMEF